MHDKEKEHSKEYYSKQELGTMLTQLQNMFECKRCGNCERVETSKVYLDTRDIRRMAKYIGVTHEKFMEDYIVKIDGKLYFKYGLPCAFYDEKEEKCNIHEARPRICRDYPFLAMGYDPVERGKIPAIETCVESIEVARKSAKTNKLLII